MSNMIADTLEQPSAASRPLWPNIGIRAAAVTEIGLDELSVGDLLLIQTANSVYSFTLTDAGSHSGLLMGGRLGETSATAWLVGAQEDKGDDGAIGESYLADGLRAVFLVAAGGNSRRLVTSAIKRLTHLKVPAGRPAGPLEDARQFSAERDKLRP
jgi:hypothetical protein